MTNDKRQRDLLKFLRWALKFPLRSFSRCLGGQDLRGASERSARAP